MPGPMRNHSSSHTLISDDKLISLMPLTSANIARYNVILDDQTKALSAATEVPAGLSASTEGNGDIYLRHADGSEAEFTVIGVLCGESLVAPPSFPKNRFPHYLRWIKLSAPNDPTFDAAITAREVLYNLLALKAKDIKPRRSFRIGSFDSFRPAAEMLTFTEVNPNATAAKLPPFYNARPFELAISHGHGEVAFTTDNEVLYFLDKTGHDGHVTRSEVGPNSVDVGQVVQVTLRFRALQRSGGEFVFREMLKSICILDEGISTALARGVAEQSAKARDAKREPGAPYHVYRRTVQTGDAHMNVVGES